MASRFECSLILIENNADVLIKTPSKSSPLHLLASISCDDPILLYKVFFFFFLI
jgi:hypothetical protein